MEQLSSVNCSYQFKKNDMNGRVTLSQDTSVVVPTEDSNDPKILCFSSDITKARRNLEKAKSSLKRPGSFQAELCSLFFGIILSLIFSLWASINVYSEEGFWIYIFLVVSGLIFFFCWYLLKNKSKKSSEEAGLLIEAVLQDFLPDPENVEPLKDES